MKGIFVEADAPEFLENEIEPEREVLDLNTLNVVDMLAARRARQLNFDTAPFDPEGHDMRFFPGGFTVWSGFPGTGKTTLLRQFVCHLLRGGKSVFVASLEEDPQDVFCRLAAVAIGSEELTADALQWCIDCWHDKLRLWSYRRGIAETGRILAVVRVLAKQGVRHAIIDSLARLDVHSGDWEAQRLFGNSLEATAAVSGTHIHLVAHPRKLVSAQQEPDINDIAGSADIGRLADNVLFVRRPDSDSPIPSEFSPMRVSVRKQRYHTGACSTIDGYFNKRFHQWKPHLHDIHVTRYLPAGAYGETSYHPELKP
jgi:twinkle protein